MLLGCYPAVYNPRNQAQTCGGGGSAAAAAAGGRRADKSAREREKQMKSPQQNARAQSKSLAQIDIRQVLFALVLAARTQVETLAKQNRSRSAVLVPRARLRVALQ